MKSTPRTPRVKDPKQLPVQLNVDVPWEFREHLISLAKEQNVSLSHMVRNALLGIFPLHKG